MRHTGAMRVLVIDNYDSFVYNLVQYLAQLGAEPVVRRNDEVDLDELDEVHGVLVSPGPGTPDRAGSSVDVVRRAAGDLGLVRSAHRHVTGAEIDSCLLKGRDAAAGADRLVIDRHRWILRVVVEERPLIERRRERRARAGERPAPYVDRRRRCRARTRAAARGGEHGGRNAHEQCPHS